MTHPRHQEIWDAIVDAIAGHQSEPCTVNDGHNCPHMRRLADALSCALDGRDIDEQLDVVLWLIRQLATTQLTNARTESEDHGHVVAMAAGFNISESGGLLAGMLYLAQASDNPELRAATITMIRTIGDTAIFRTVAAIMPSILEALKIRHRQMTTPTAGSR